MKLSMKLNAKAVILMAIAGLSVTTLVSLPLVAQAQATREPVFPEAHERLEELANELELTEEQRSQFQQLREERRAELDAIITPEQQQAFREAIANGATFRDAMQTVNLSDQQRQDIYTLLESARDEARDILIPAQQEELQIILRSRIRDHRSSRLN